MTNINPTYYAENATTDSYVLQGFGFSLIPNDAKGILAANNDQPLQFVDSNIDNFLFTINVVDDNNAILTCIEPQTHTANNYLGAIVSQDRQVIYWINDTKPLP